MRATSAEITAAAATNGEGQPDATTGLLDAMLDRIAAERDACAKLPDPELARRAGRNVLAAVACAADAILANANLLQSAPEKLAAFLEKVGRRLCCGDRGPAQTRGAHRGGERGCAGSARG
jgi:hypothetical protein